MSQPITIPNEPSSTSPPTNTPTTGNRRPPPSQPRIPLHQVYALPAPVRTFPLPTFFPSNPISLVHLIFAWVRQIVSPPPAEPSVVHQGIWDPSTGSVHIKDPKSIRALWEQGFFGKGSLSRSEPNWLKREQNRRGALQSTRVSEQHTESRREERRLAKWERAKTELEAIERQRQEEANATTTAPVEVEEITLNGDFKGPRGPVTPADLLALPNSLVVVEESQLLEEVAADVAPAPKQVQELPRDASHAPVTPAGILALPNSLVDLEAASLSPGNVVARDRPVLIQSLAEPSPADVRANGHANGKVVDGNARTNGLVNGVDSHSFGASTSSDHDSDDNGAVVNGLNGKINGVSSSVSSVPSPPSNGSTGACPNPEKAPLKRRKSVRFSPEVESTTFQHTDPPSPNRSADTSVRRAPSPAADDSNPTVASETDAPAAIQLSPSPESLTVSELPVPIPVGDLVDKEHFQLAPEEAFFVAFGLGALSVVDPVTGAPIPTDHLLTLFRSYSYFPPRKVGSTVTPLQPSDPFLVQYAVYHHFRSLGWVPRHGIKFGVDFILYQRGPVFDHSEFGLIIVPSFSDPLWKDHEHDTPKRSWSWLMGVNRVLSHVLKGLVLVYVDVPSPALFDELVRQGGIAAALKKYTIREVMVRRFSANRNR